MKPIFFSFWCFVCLAGTSLADDEALPEIAPTITDSQAYPGYLPFYYQPESGRILMEVSRWDEDLLYLTALPGGLGSNDIGLDRGQLGNARVVRFRRFGPKVLLEQQNLRFRADSESAAEQRAVREAFPTSVVAGFKVVAASGTSALIDVTDLILSDAYGVGSRISQAQQGSYKFDPQRSAPAIEHSKNFPQNTVLEAWITLTGQDGGNELRRVSPSASAITVRQRHEFIALPQDDFERRPYHPRSGFFSSSYRDYAAGLDQNIDKRLLVRHRINRDKPLVYYVDRGAPEPIRSALLDGARWWAQAFDAAGLNGLYRVELLPEGADPLDLRYNVIQWVHRSTRGWSYGRSVVDPRSGEILKGHVTLGSLRIRQDLLIAEGLTAPFARGDEAAEAQRALALARIRQLSAHEVGHTLGLAHNFAASISQDASVMDYPHPFISLDSQGRIVLDRAYDTDIGEWDKLAIAYGYRPFANAAARTRGLADILAAAERQGLRFISDPDARGFASVHAVAHLWDNGADPLPRLDQLMAVRDVALSQFSSQVLRRDRTLSEAERNLVPVYLLHRYQAEAVAKLLGGLDYRYALSGESSQLSQVSAERQQAALTALIDTLSIERLQLSEQLLEQLPPPEFGYRRDREYFTHATGTAFDPAAPARAATQLIAELLLEPSRAQRLLAQHAGDQQQPGLQQILTALTDATLLGQVDNGAPAYLAAARAWIVLREMQRLAVQPRASDQVRATLINHLSTLPKRLTREGSLGRALAREIERFLDQPDQASLPPRHPIPPGSPI